MSECRFRMVDIIARMLRLVELSDAEQVEIMGAVSDLAMDRYNEGYQKGYNDAVLHYREGSLPAPPKGE